MVPRREVCPVVLRRLFNALELDKLVATGELTISVSRGYPAPTLAGQDPGTVSQIVRDVSRDGRVIAVAFRYLQPDGRLGASGKPDPKWIAHEGEELIPCETRIILARDCTAPEGEGNSG